MISIENFTGYPDDGKVRLVEKLSDTSGFYVCDNDPVYATEAEGENEHKREAETACLKLMLGAKLRPVNDEGDELENDGERRFDIIRLINWTSNRECTAFIELCEMHANEETSLSFEDFFYSLNELFQPNKEQSNLNAYGLYCELALIDQLSNKMQRNIDFTDYWQLDGSNSKYDFTFPKGNIEVKSANKDVEVMIKQDQLFNKDNNYLVAVCVEKNPSGETLIDLIDRLLHRSCCFTTLRSRMELTRRVLQVDEKDLGKRMKVCFIRSYEAKFVNPFTELSDRVTQLSYRLNLVDVEYENEIELVDKLLMSFDAT